MKMKRRRRRYQKALNHINKTIKRLRQVKADADLEAGAVMIRSAIIERARLAGFELKPNGMPR